MKNRQSLTKTAFDQLMRKNPIPGFDYDSFKANTSESFAIALSISGGGYRAMLVGAGAVSALDSRSPVQTHLSGLLQSATYIAGISGGSWLVMSLFVNDFTAPHLLVRNASAWTLDSLLLEGVVNFDAEKVQNQLLSKPFMPQFTTREKEGVLSSIRKVFTSSMKDSTVEANEQSPSFLIEGLLLPIMRKNMNATLPPVATETSAKTIFAFYNSLQCDVRPKRQLGFHVSFTDYWGRALSRKIFKVLEGSPRSSLSENVNLPSFKNFSQPFPIICSIERFPGSQETSVDSHLFEFTPYDFGSWDSYLNAFFPVKYLGTAMYNGTPITHSKSKNVSICYRGFDNVGFVTGTSSTLFSHIFAFIYQMQDTFKLDAILAITNILKTFGLSSQYTNTSLPQFHPDYALYSPNPFHGYHPRSNASLRVTANNHLYLADGGEDGQNIPFQPLLQPQREVDLILTFDMTSDRDNYPNGTSLAASQLRYHSSSNELCFHRDSKARSRFPYVPTPQQIVDQHLNKRPVFFGCNLQNDYPLFDGIHGPSDKCNSQLPPVIVYHPNVYQGHHTNRSTFQLCYTADEALDMMSGGHGIATHQNSKFYATCLMCAVLKRAFDRHRTEIPDFCRRCYSIYCWHRPS